GTGWRRRVGDDRIARQIEVVERQERVAVFRAKLRNPIADDVDDAPERQRRIEAATDAEIERDVVASLRQGASRVRGRRDHADAADQDVDAMTPRRCRTRAFRFAPGRRDDQHAHHSTSSSGLETVYGVATRLTTIVRPNSTSTTDATSPM